MQIPFLKWNRLSQQICWALGVMKLICQRLGPRNFIKVKQGHISEMHFWTEKKLPALPVAKGVPFQLLEKIAESSWCENMGVLFDPDIFQTAHSFSVYCSHVILIWKGTCLLSLYTFTFQHFRWEDGRYLKKLFLFHGFWESIQDLVFSLDCIMLLLGKCHGNAFSNS